MKVWKRGKAKMRVSPSGYWMPTGYYKNRPNLFQKFMSGGLGSLDSVRVII